MTNQQNDTPIVEGWERVIKRWGWKEAVAVVFRRLMPIVDLDVDPPVEHLRTNDNMDLNGSEKDINTIIELVTAQSHKEAVEKMEGYVEVVDALASGAAFDKETGLIWQHWIDKAKAITNLSTPNKEER